jgi:hypothetical protein
MKSEQYTLEDQHAIWTFPRFNPHINGLPVINSVQSREEETDGFEFNDLDTDERVNSEIIQFDYSFPDPLNYCIGYYFCNNLVKKSANDNYKSVKEYGSTSNVLENNGTSQTLSTISKSCNSPQIQVELLKPGKSNILDHQHKMLIESEY